MARSRLRSAICQTLVRFENRVLILLPHTPLMTFSLMLHSESLGLHNNGLEGTIPSRLTALTDLALLYLDNNRLTGNIPESIGNLSNIGKTRIRFHNSIASVLTVDIVVSMTVDLRLRMNTVSFSPDRPSK